LDQAAELGINLIDTAECYGDHLSESFIGNYLSRRDRDKWVVATKFGHHFHDLFTRTDEFSAESVIKQLDASLKALHTDYIDLYQFHSGPDALFDNDELWTTLDKQVQAGKIRHLGTSIGSNANIHQTASSTKVNSKAIQVVYKPSGSRTGRSGFPILYRSRPRRTRTCTVGQWLSKR
jgi:aryl-alcohol dehydrogenase-like predicted oxidoreductase